MGIPITQGIYVAAKLGIADLLAEGPRPADELARLTGTHPPSLYRLLRMLVSIGVFAEGEGRSFRLTPTSQYLRTGQPGSVRLLAVLGGERWHLHPWTDLLESVKTGRPAFDRLYGQRFFEFLASNSEAAAVFDGAMDAVVGRFATAVAAAYDFGRAGTVIDVGGGHGALLAEVLRRHLTVRGVLFDLPVVIAEADRIVPPPGTDGRLTTVAGDFFTTVPRGGDVYVLSHVLHDWDDESAVKILRRCAEAMGAGARLLVVEVVPGPAPDFYGSWLDLEMLVHFGGRERSAAEYEGLLGRAGLGLVQVLPTQTPVSILEAEAVQR
jgi:hypothetical protein